MELGERRGCPKTEEPVGNLFIYFIILMLNGSMLILYLLLLYSIVWFLLIRPSLYIYDVIKPWQMLQQPIPSPSLH